MGPRAKWNTDFFTRRDPTVAYWAGFLLADGTVYYNKAGVGRLSLTVSDKDIGHLRQYSKAVGAPVRPHGRRAEISLPNGETIGPNECLASRVSVSRMGLESELEPWGIVRRKSYNWSEPRVDHDLIPFFLGGVIDGDGCIDKPGNRIRLTAHRDSVDWFCGVLASLGQDGVMGVRDAHGSKVAKVISISGSGRIENLKNQVHNNNLDIPHLARKWDRIGG